MWKGAPSADVRSKARFQIDALTPPPDPVAEVLKAGTSVTIRSVHWQGQHLYVPEIDYNGQRRQVLLWKREIQPDVLSKARLLVEAVPGTGKIRLKTCRYSEVGMYLYCPAINGSSDGKRGEVLVRLFESLF